MAQKHRTQNALNLTTRRWSTRLESNSVDTTCQWRFKYSCHTTRHVVIIILYDDYDVVMNDTRRHPFEDSQRDDATTTSHCGHLCFRRPWYWMTWQFPSVQKFNIILWVWWRTSWTVFQFKHCLWWLGGCLSYIWRCLWWVLFRLIDELWLMNYICAGRNVSAQLQQRISTIRCYTVESAVAGLRIDASSRQSWWSTDTSSVGSVADGLDVVGLRMSDARQRVVIA